MENVEAVQLTQPHRHMDESLPDLLLAEEVALLLVEHYLLVEVTVVGKLHDDTEFRPLYHSELASMKACLYPII